MLLGVEPLDHEPLQLRLSPTMDTSHAAYIILGLAGWMHYDIAHGADVHWTDVISTPTALAKARSLGHLRRRTLH